MARIGSADFERDRLAQPGCGAAADRNRAVGAQAFGFSARLARYLDRHVHNGARKHAGATRSQPVRHVLRLCLLFGSREDQGATGAQ